MLIVPPGSTGLMVAVVPTLVVAAMMIGVGWLRFIKSDLRG